MKLTILVDNNTLIDRYYLGEPALSFWIEADGLNVLFDAAYSDIFIRNAQLLGIDLGRADFIVLSHGHLDHTWGLEPLVDLLGQEKTRGTRLTAHPFVFDRKTFRGYGDIGSQRRAGEMEERFDLQLSSKPVWLSERLCFLGEIPRANDFEAGNSIGTVVRDGREIPDFLIDDTALAYKGRDGLVVIAGCSHAGICNTLAYAREVCDEERIADIVGGFHLLDAPSGLMEKTCRYIQSCKPAATHPCHCTDLKARGELGRHVKVEEVGSGTVLEYR